MAGDADGLFHFIQLSDFISTLPLSKSMGETGIKTPSIRGYFWLSKPTLNFGYLITEAEQSLKSLSVHPSVPQIPTEWPPSVLGDGEGVKHPCFSGSNSGVEQTPMVP